MLSSVTASSARLAEFTVAFPGNVFGSVVSGNLRQVLLGTFTFTGANTPGVTNITASRYTTGGSYIVDDNLNEYDALTAVASATITTTPEPSTLVLGGIAALALLVLRRRRAAA
jgi:hypothetical protein